nr:uncharacterized protein LOC113695370 [Coffea arabica]XP_027103353.1 uncharacterized protein LOC113724674 [Coffea arabica]
MVRQFCDCGKQTLMMTSWTAMNPGRRFCRCAKYREQGGCIYWDWVDPEMCQRSKEIIPGLLRSMNKMEAELDRLKENSRKEILAFADYVITSTFRIPLAGFSVLCCRDVNHLACEHVLHCFEFL